jgi:hypothetical protein
LNQISNPFLDATDTVKIVPRVVIAAGAVTDPSKAALITADIPTDTLFARPGDSGPRQIEMAQAFAFWKLLTEATTPRAVVLTSLSEGSSPLEIRFTSNETAALRPRLRISFTLPIPLGLP